MPRLKKRSDAAQPWVANYPALKEWLDKHEARCQQQIPVGGTKEEPDRYLEYWLFPSSGKLAWIEVRSGGMGWEIYTAQDSPDIEETLEDADARLKLGAWG